MNSRFNKKNVTILTILLSLSMILLSTGCAQSETTETTAPVTETNTPVTEAKTEEETAATTDITEDTAPEQTEAASEPQWIFESTDLNDNKVNHSYLADNKVTLVNVWSTTCPSCKAEMPDLAQAAKAYADKNVGFLGIVSDIYEGEPDEAFRSIARDILEDAGIAYSNVMASDTIIQSILSAISAVPTTFFTDSEGRIIGNLVVGAMSLEQIIENIEIALAEAE